MLQKSPGGISFGSARTIHLETAFSFKGGRQVLSLSEVLWPCTLFVILAVVRFQEPPRQRENCYLEARDLPSRGLYPFVQSLFCNVGSRCKNSSYTAQKNNSFRASSSQRDRNSITEPDMAFLKDVKELMQGISETTKKAAALQTLWEERSKLLDPEGSPVFLGMNLNETEKMISTMEHFHNQPYFWDLLYSLPWLQKGSLSQGHRIEYLSNLLHTIQNMRIIANSIGCGGLHYILCLGDIVWIPSVKTELESQLGFEKIYIERILNSTMTLNKIPTKDTLEQLVCSVLSAVSEAESDKGDNNKRDCIFSPWLEAQTYLVHSVDQIKLYTKIQLLQSAIHGQHGMPISIADGYLGWRAIGEQLAETSASCSEIMKLLSKTQYVPDASFSSCQEQLLQSLFWDTLDELWFGFEKKLYWKGLSTFVRRTCEMAYYANKREGFLRGQPAWEEIQTSFIELEEMTELLKNVSQDQNILSCAEILNNVTQLMKGNSVLDFLAGWLKNISNTSSSQNSTRVGQIMKLFQEAELTEVMQVLHFLSEVVNLFERAAPKNMTDALIEGYHFMLKQSTNVAALSTEDLSKEVNSLVELLELATDMPLESAKALSCLAAVICWNITTISSWDEPVSKACRVDPQQNSSTVYEVAAEMIEQLRTQGESLCSDERFLKEVTYKMACFLGHLEEWHPVILKLSENHTLDSSVLNEVMTFWTLARNRSLRESLETLWLETERGIENLSADFNVRQLLLLIARELHLGRKLKNVQVAHLILQNSLLNVIHDLAAKEEELHSNDTDDPIMEFIDLFFDDAHYENYGEDIAPSQIRYRNKMFFLLKDLHKDIIAEMSVFPRDEILALLKLDHLDNLNKEVDEVSQNVTYSHLGDYINSLLNEAAIMSTSEELPFDGAKGLMFARNVFNLLLRNPTVKNITRSHKELLSFVNNLLYTVRSAVEEKSLKEAAERLHLNKGQLDSLAAAFLDLTSLMMPLDPSRSKRPDAATIEGGLVESLSQFSDALEEDISKCLASALNYSIMLERLVEGVADSIANSSKEASSLVENILDFLVAIKGIIQKPNSKLILTQNLKQERGGDEVQKIISYLLEVQSLEREAFVKAEVPEGFWSNSSEKDPDRWIALLERQDGILMAFGLMMELIDFTSDFIDGDLSTLSFLSSPVIQNAHTENTLSSSARGICENFVYLKKKLSATLAEFQRGLYSATSKNCECRRDSESIQRHMEMLAEALQAPVAGNPLMAFLHNFSLPTDVKIKDCMQNTTEVARELRSLTSISDKSIDMVMESSISYPKFLSKALTATLVGRCDAEALRPLLTFPAEDGAADAVKELCSLPPQELYTMTILLLQNLDVRGVIYKIKLPSEVDKLLNMLLDVVSNVSSLLNKAQRIFENLPAFLQTLKSTSMLDISSFQSIFQNRQPRSLAVGSLQSLIKGVCKEDSSFFSSANMFIDMPRITEILEEDMAKFSIPEDSTQFCLQLYQEILQSPNGALIWTFLKPLLHGRILYTPNTKNINLVMQKANWTFGFVDNLKTYSEAWLRMTELVKHSENFLMISQLQEALQNTFIKNFVESQLDLDVGELMGKLQVYETVIEKMLNDSAMEQIGLLAQLMGNLSACLLLDRFQPVESVEKLEAKAHELMQQNNFLASIIFNVSSHKRGGADIVQELPKRLSYTIRTSILYSLRTDLIKNPVWKSHPQNLPADGFKYNHVFIPLQDMIERAIISVHAGVDTLDTGIQVQAMPYPCHTSDLFLNNIGFFFPLIMMLTWMVSVASMVRKLVYEREIHLEECFLSTTAFGQGVFLLTLLEGQELGIQWNNIYQPLAKGGPMTFGWACWMILLDSIIYFMIGWYFSNIIPGRFGLRRPWHFPFSLTYWKKMCGVRIKKQSSFNPALFFVNENFQAIGMCSLRKDLEKGGEEANQVGVLLRSLTKEYPESNKTAVKDLSLAFYKGHITALLGPNGAGKTTVISMLTGLFPPSSGNIIVNGKDMETDLAAIWTEMGVCPQYDVLFDSLTVREHLWLYGTLKVPLWTKVQLHQHVTRALKDVGLLRHQSKYVRALSGGMKRRLSIAISFIGDSKTVVLDEPTSSLDPCSRRSIWDILLKYKEGRTLIFTTHHLDEAEALCDRIAILQHGQLSCCGSPSYLKEVYGQGHSLTFTKKLSVFAFEDPRETLRLTALVQAYIPEAFLKEDSGSELTYMIPTRADKAAFKGLFQALDEKLQYLHVTGYGISDTTLEKCVSRRRVAKSPRSRSLSRATRGGNSLVEAQSVRGARLVLTQIAALLMKRLRHTRRDWRGTLSNVLLPVIFVAMAMALFTVKPLAIDYPSLKLTPGLYDNAESFFSTLQAFALRHHVLAKNICRHILARNAGVVTCPAFNISAPYMKNKKGHTLYNLSALNIEEYLIRPPNKARFGGWSFGETPATEPQIARAKKPHDKLIAKAWYNQKGFHALPSYLNQLNNLILWKNLPSNVDWKQYGITLYSCPYGGALLDEDKIMENVRQCGVALCIVLGFSILTASIGSSIVKDRASGAKRLQHISGLGYRTYWLANFLYDMLLYLVPVSLCIGVITVFQLSAFTFRENLAATALLLILFGEVIGRACSTA
ncbi:PREDICTED: ATP-binding cassette sub-family A member 13, partial [Gekko japonicus]|uniref:ATP-binding cassette sub-family A member 13 n=1 Tax=Gekko japonicus TaxID=146911 RepID=A0ABM1L5Q7_GEKJA